MGLRMDTDSAVTLSTYQGPASEMNTAHLCVSCLHMHAHACICVWYVVELLSFDSLKVVFQNTISRVSLSETDSEDLVSGYIF